MTELAYIDEVGAGPRPGLARPRAAHPAVEVLNIVAAVGAVIFLLPMLVVIALAIYCQDGGPVLFRHRRVGHGGRPFYCLKFRTMTVDAEDRLREILARDAGARAEWALAQKLRHDPRVTPFGAILRRTSLDELPQLLNLLRGEMSLVGPRPIVEAEIPRFGWRIRQYCAVKPGVTGLWQVSGRSDITYRQRVALDCLYVRRKSLALDLRILLCTIPAVLGRRGSC